MQEISERLLLAASNTLDTHGFASGASTTPSHPRHADTSPAPDSTHSSYPTVTYGEWYDFHDVSSLMSPSPSLTFKVSFCLVCRVHQSHHNYTGPPHCMAVSPKASIIFSFSSNPCGAGSNAAPKVLKWSPVSNELCNSLEWHTDPKT